MRKRGKAQGPNSAGRAQCQEGGAEQKDLSQHLRAAEMLLLSAFSSVPGGHPSTSALCRASSTAPLPHNSPFDVVILDVTDFPFRARWSDLMEARGCAGFLHFRWFQYKTCKSHGAFPCFCGIMSWTMTPLHRRTEKYLLQDVRFLTKASLWHELLNCLHRVLI